MTNTEVYTNISKIIERDSKSTTYKFALLRGVIDIILDNSPFIEVSKDRVKIPLGLMIEKWLMYYYPIIECDKVIPQINGNTQLAFEPHFRKIIRAYDKGGKFSEFYNDLTCKSIPTDIQVPFLDLVKKLRNAIMQMPMKYIGTSVNNSHYSIFQFSGKPIQTKAKFIDIEYLIDNCGSFSIPIEYYETFRFLGRFVNGQDSILFKWAEFSVNASGKRLAVENVLPHILRSPVTEREVSESKKIYQRILREEGKVRCVWTDKVLDRYDVDHVIPFSIWKNNDLWNLLPSSPIVNNKKRDKIPAASVIEGRKDAIIHYWDLLNIKFPQRFQKEIKVALLGDFSGNDWQHAGIEKLKQDCDYLIAGRGYEPWKN